VIYIGTGTCGRGAGALSVLQCIRHYVSDRVLDVEIVEVGCIGLCAEEPVVDVQLPGKARVSFGRIQPDVVEMLLDSIFEQNVLPQLNLLWQYRSDDSLALWPDVCRFEEHPFFRVQNRFVLRNCGVIAPHEITDYLAVGGYEGLARALRELTPHELIELVRSSGLRGRGGGGFSTGQKWFNALERASGQKFVVCNADESDPGAFMDRALIESNPHSLLEGLAIAAYAIGAGKAFVYVRSEYPLAAKRLEEAVAQARDWGLAGENILDSGMNLDIQVRRGAGAFAGGEETALLNSLEGKRAMARPKPPYPVDQGLFGKPTVVNNVETLANVPHIVNGDDERFKQLGTSKSVGTKVFAVSGDVIRTGLVEVEMGSTIRDVVFEAAGGIGDGHKLKAVQIGGPSGGCLPESLLNVCLDYESLAEVGTMMGSGGFVVIDDSTCMVEMACFFMQFLQKESCGKCIPCREGARRLLELLQYITGECEPPRGRDATSDLMTIRRLAVTMQDTSLCGLGKTAPNPVLSTLKWFSEEFDAHLFERTCPTGVCDGLTPDMGGGV
jgi:NADH:ubiquinone oxidoreductase subunit F (NADH-binding)/(2Fe-2S) ferredoxin